MKTYTIITEVAKARGSQHWTVEADSKEHALELYLKGEAVFVTEEIEVMELHKPEIYEGQ